MISPGDLMHVDISPQLRGFERTRSAASMSDERNSEDIKRAQKTEATNINLRMSLATFPMTEGFL